MKAGEDWQQTFELVRRKLRVRVMDPTGKKPLSGWEVRVVIHDASSWPGGMMTTDEDGWLTIDPAPAGEITLLRWPGNLMTKARRDGWAKRNPEREVRELMLPFGKVQLPAGKTGADVSVRMQGQR